jgi:hypothetical protein
MVIVVARKDLCEKRVQPWSRFFRLQYVGKNPKDYLKREKFALNYCQKNCAHTFDFIESSGKL